MLGVIGDVLEDVIVRLNTHAVQIGTDNPATIERRRGGSAANVAVAAAGLVTTRFIGRVGTDALGDRLIADLEAAGVVTAVERSGRSGTVVVLVDPSGERTMFPDRATSAELGAFDPVWLDGLTHLHAPAYGLFVAPMSDAVRTALDAARRRGIAVSIDVSAASLLVDFGVAHFVEFVRALGPDLIFANRDEAEVLAGTGWFEALGADDPIIVIKNGPDAARLWTGERWETIAPETVIDGVDTTGAGDAFAAGFLAAWATGAPLEDACRTAHRIAVRHLLDRPESTAVSGD